MLCNICCPQCVYAQLLPAVTLLLYAETPPAVASLTTTKNTLKACSGSRSRFKDRAIYNSVTSTDGVQDTLLGRQSARVPGVKVGTWCNRCPSCTNRTRHYTLSWLSLIFPPAEVWMLYRERCHISELITKAF